MTRNEMDRYSFNPTNVDRPRSTFHMPHRTLLSGDISRVIPFDCFEVLPGDSFSVNTSLVARLQPLVAPVMDNLYLDTMYFYVPSRLVWEHFENLHGQNDTDYWTPDVQYSVPQLIFKDGNGNDVACKQGTIADYLGIPINVVADNLSISALPFRAYAKIINDWWRDENLQNPVHLDISDSNSYYGVPDDDQVTGIEIGGFPFKANKIHDLFTSCLPQPQKSSEIILPIGDFAPVLPSGLYEFFGNNSTPSNQQRVNVDLRDGRFFSGVEIGQITDSEHWQEGYVEGYVRGGSDYTLMRSGASDLPGLMEHRSNASGTGGQPQITPIFNNLVADLQNATGVSINDLRTSFQLQKFAEASARGGSRFLEMLKAHFGVTSPDARLQRSEYLGGSRTPISVTQVTQTSSTSGQPTPMGDVAGQSVTNDYHDGFTKSFVEHGYVMGLCVLRYKHTYCQGIPKMFKRRTQFDFYYPEFANVGEQPIYEDEIYLIGKGEDTSIKNSDVFGYAEAWANGYRYIPDKCCGEMRPQASNTLSSWHFADDYKAPPTLTAEWIREDLKPVDRALAVSSEVANQFFADFYIDTKATRVMPLFSIPGLTDHH
ncbi:major capsid protein [Capybara microvirus Cap1_SP_188]|nr:major capsid protein [Capybara microvirus Cap1_SP_188]